MPTYDLKVYNIHRYIYISALNHNIIQTYIPSSRNINNSNNNNNLRHNNITRTNKQEKKCPLCTTHIYTQRDTHKPGRRCQNYKLKVLRVNMICRLDIITTPQRAVDISNIQNSDAWSWNICLVLYKYTYDMTVESSQSWSKWYAAPPKLRTPQGKPTYIRERG